MNVLNLVINYLDTNRMSKQFELFEKLSIHSEEHMIDCDIRDNKHLFEAWSSWM